ncbi:MAG: hypothetical protein LBV52_02920 [Spirochaetaceae bacterium]|jgi:archaellum component FlaC|nr:hypothetical protein [Spirochaetaceae bacterium]
MKIFIDDKKADIVLENEKSLGDVFKALDAWLRGAGLCISAVGTDEDDTPDIEALFERDILSVNELRIKTSLLSSMHCQALKEALAALQRDACVKQNWLQSPSAQFLHENDADMFLRLKAAFNGDSAGNLVELLQEKIRDIEYKTENPAAEFISFGSTITDLAKRLEDFSLDMQTGKDKKALETIEMFSSTVDKLFYLIHLLCIEDSVRKKTNIDSQLEELSTVLKDFLSAYENTDMILSGDLAEYEIAPRLLSIYAAVKKTIPMEP